MDPSQGGERDLELQNEASVTQIKRFLIPFPSASPGKGGRAASHTLLELPACPANETLPPFPGKGVCPTRQRGHGGCGPNPRPGGELEVREKQCKCGFFPPQLAEGMDGLAKNGDKRGFGNLLVP